MPQTCPKLIPIPVVAHFERGKAALELFKHAARERQTVVHNRAEPVSEGFEVNISSDCTFQSLFAAASRRFDQCLSLLAKSTRIQDFARTDFCGGFPFIE